MKKLIVLSVAVFAFSLGVFAFYVFKPVGISKAKVSEFENFKNTPKFNVSYLKVGETASFPAVLVKMPGTNCIELFNPADYKKYNGDPLWAATSKLAVEPRFMFLSWWKKEVIVTGNMTFVRNVVDTSKTCGIGAGQIFEITNVSEF